MKAITITCDNCGSIIKPSEQESDGFTVLHIGKYLIRIHVLNYEKIRFKPYQTSEICGDCIKKIIAEGKPAIDGNSI